MQRIDSPSFLVKYCALSAAIVADDVAPAIRTFCLRTIHGLARACIEMLSYSISGCYEFEKATLQPFPNVVCELYQVPQGIPSAILKESGNYLLSGGCELCKHLFVLLGGCEECLERIFELFFQHVTQELLSYTTSGGKEAHRALCKAVFVTYDTLSLSIYAVQPFAEEIFSYLTSGTSQLGPAVRTTLLGASEALQTISSLSEAVWKEFFSTLLSGLYEVCKAGRTFLYASAQVIDLSYLLGKKTARESLSYVSSGIFEMERSCLTAAMIFENLRALAIYSPLRIGFFEISSYCISGAHEILKGEQLFPSIIDESSYEIKRRGKQALIELSTYVASGALQLLHSTMILFHASKEILSIFQYAILKIGEELMSSLSSGVSEASKGAIHAISIANEETLQRTFQAIAQELLSYGVAGSAQMAVGNKICLSSLDEATFLLQDNLCTLLLESLLSASSGVGEVGRTMIALPSLVVEGVQLPKELLTKGVQELFSYFLSGLQEEKKGTKTTYTSLSETGQLPKELVEEGIAETISYASSGVLQSISMEKFATEDLFSCCYYAILLPIKGKFNYYVVLGRRIRHAHT